MNGGRDQRRRAHGGMEMGDRVNHTRGAPWGTGFKSGHSSWLRSVEGVHGNSALSSRMACLYRLEDANGSLLKWGIRQELNGRR